MRINADVYEERVTDAQRVVYAGIAAFTVNADETQVDGFELDDREERTSIVVETVAQGRLRDFFGFNRAKHAVVEAAILATRADWLPIDELLGEFRKLAIVVDKTGGPRERAAFTLLNRHLRETVERRGFESDPSRSPS